MNEILNVAFAIIVLGAATGISYGLGRYTVRWFECRTNRIDRDE